MTVPGTPKGAELAQRLRSVDQQIAEAARAVGRAPEEITRIVVTKFHPPELVRQLIDLGVGDVGENRQQELVDKAAAVATDGPLRWHFVGQLQTKKARAVARVAAVVHSVDRGRLVDALADDARPTPLAVLLQINLTDDPARGGVNPAELELLAEHAVSTPGLDVRGVMAVAPREEPAATAFERVRQLSQRLRTIVPDATWISAGMSGDFREAIAAGATHLRIGTAITGPRPIQG